MKKVLSAILAASMVLSLAACGQQKSTESKASGESKAEGQSQTGAEGAVWKIGLPAEYGSVVVFKYDMVTK